jgi:hypothetical protein
MITKKSITLAILLALTTIQADTTLHSPTSTCNIKQAQIMKQKCNKLDSREYQKCEDETLKAFYTCLKNEVKK